MGVIRIGMFIQRGTGQVTFRYLSTFDPQCCQMKPADGKESDGSRMGKGPLGAPENQRTRTLSIQMSFTFWAPRSNTTRPWASVGPWVQVTV